MTKKEDGAVLLIEAAIVFPILVIVVFFIICLGNAYYVRAYMDKVANENAIIAANYAVNEMILTTETNNFDLTNHDINPYQYSVSDNLKTALNVKVGNEVKNEANTIFASMAPSNISDFSGGTDYVKFKWGLFSSTVTVEIKYTVNMIPMLKNLGITSAEYTTCGKSNLNDNVEFIRNLDLLKDLFTDFTQTDLGQDLTGKAAGKIKEVISKVSDFLNFFKKKK